MYKLLIISLSLLLLGCGGGSGSPESPPDNQAGQPSQPPFSMPSKFKYEIHQQSESRVRSGSGVISDSGTSISFSPDVISNGGFTSSAIFDIIEIDNNFNLKVLINVYSYYDRGLVMQFEVDLQRDGLSWEGSSSLHDVEYTVKLSGEDALLPDIDFSEISENWEYVYYEGIGTIYSYFNTSDGYLSGTDDYGCSIDGFFEKDYKNLFYIEFELTNCHQSGVYYGHFNVDDKGDFYRLQGVAGNDDAGVVIDQRIYK